VEKKIRCPKCSKIFTCNGNPGEEIFIKCSNCGTEGKIILEKIEPIASKSLVVIDNTSKKYKDVLAVDNISFNIKQGEVFGYIGPNGAGKTTTIKMMIGLLKQTNGSIYINGYKMPEQKESAHRFIGYMPQDVGIQQWRTINHALTTFGKLSGVDSKTLQDRINEMLELFQLSKYKNKKISKLSGGTVQKLGIIQALLHKPKLLILDEPLSGLDPDSRFQVKKIIKDLSNNGTTIFFSSHILSDVQDIATKIIIIDDGHIVKIGSLDELKSEFLKEYQIEIIFSKKSEKFIEIEKISGVKSITKKSDDKLLVKIEKISNIDEIIHKIIKALLENNCKIRSIKPLSPSLDEVYQFYLGKGGK